MIKLPVNSAPRARTRFLLASILASRSSRVRCGRPSSSARPIRVIRELASSMDSAIAPRMWPLARSSSSSVTPFVASV